ncbi:PIN domain-containing protein [Rhizobium herbae]|uniref:PIN domain-containing protein n=1 Tax=Rhizobium herbae TaxID=508661 RepID=UPI001C9E9322
MVEALQLKEGDEVAVRIAGERDFEIGRDQSRERALERIKASPSACPLTGDLIATRQTRVNVPLLDTNVLIYAFTDDPRAARAWQLLSEPFILSVQALNEFANVARRKLGMNWTEIQGAIGDISTLATAIMPLDRECNFIGS